MLSIYLVDVKTYLWFSYHCKVIALHECCGDVFTPQELIPSVVPETFPAVKQEFDALRLARRSRILLILGVIT